MGTPNYQKANNNPVVQGCPFFFFSTPHVKLFNFDPPDKGGISDTVPSPKRHTKFYVKPNTGGCRELSPPCDTQNRTQGTVGSRPPPAWYKAFHSIIIIELGGDIGHSCVLVVTATAAVVDGTKELWAPSYLEGHQAWADEKKMESFLPSLAYRSIDTGHLRHLPEYTLATKILQGNQPLTDDGAWCQWYLACYRYLLLLHIQWHVCPARNYRKNREQYSTLTCCIMECLVES